MFTLRNASLMLIAGLAGLCLTSAARADDDYKIKLAHPFKVGDTFGVSTRLKMKYSLKYTADGQPQEKGEEYSCTLEGTETVLAISEASKLPTKYTVKVIKCTKDKVDIVPEGAVVVAENKDGHTEVTVDGKAPADELKQPLAEIFETTNPKDPSSDDDMGTPDPRKIGTSWDFKTDSLANKLQAEKLPFSAEDLKGKGTLNDVSKVAGKDVEKVTITIDGAFDKKDLPQMPGATCNNCRLKVQVVGMIPTDESARLLSMSASVSVSYTVVAPDGSEDISVERTRSSTFTESK